MNTSNEDYEVLKDTMVNFIIHNRPPLEFIKQHLNKYPTELLSRLAWDNDIRSVLGEEDHLKLLRYFRENRNIISPINMTTVIPEPQKTNNKLFDAAYSNPASTSEQKVNIADVGVDPEASKEIYSSSVPAAKRKMPSSGGKIKFDKKNIILGGVGIAILLLLFNN